MPSYLNLLLLNNFLASIYPVPKSSLLDIAPTFTKNHLESILLSFFPHVFLLLW